ncbi:hypothetical protein D3C80_1565830 [compost metagenome]
MNADHRIMRQLGYSAAAVSAHMQQQAAHCVKEIPLGFNDLGVAADHEHKRAFDRCRLAAGYRRIEEAAAAFFYSRRDLFDQSGGNGAGVNDYGSRLQDRQYTVFTVINLPDRIIITDHGNNNILVLRCCLRGSCNSCTGILQRLALLCRTVVHRNLVSAFQQVCRHGSAHRSESDKADLFHSISAFTL